MSELRKLETSSTRRHRLGIAIAMGGLACIVLGGWTLAQLRVSLARGPMLVSPAGLAVGPDGSVLVGVDASRVHVYDAEGRFLRGWEVPDASGPFRLQIPDAKRVQVASARTGERIDLDLAGNVLARTPDAQAWERFGPESDVEASGPAGERYSIASGGLVRLRPEPEALLVPPLRWPLALFLDALPAIPLLLGGGGVAIFWGITLASRQARR